MDFKLNSRKTNYKIQFDENTPNALDLLERLKAGLFTDSKNKENITKPSLEARLSALEEVLSDFIISLNEGE